MRPPAGIAVGRKAVTSVKGRGEGVIVGLGVGRVGIVKIGVDGLASLGGEGDAVIVRRVDVVENVEGCLHVTSRWTHIVG